MAWIRQPKASSKKLKVIKGLKYRQVCNEKNKNIYKRTVTTKTDINEKEQLFAK